MKKNLLVSLCLGTVFAVAADANASSCQIRSGAYAGVSAGLSILTGKSQFTYVNSDGPGQAQAINGNLSKTSPAVGLFAGYGMKFSNFWAAAEAFYQFDRLNAKHEYQLQGVGDAQITTNKSTGAFGAAVHLGFVPNNNCIAYAILGVEARRFNVKYSATDSAIVAAVINKKYTSFAIAPGVGVRFALSKDLSFRTEYKYAMHKKKNFANTKANPGGGNDTVTLKQSPSVHSVNVGLVYSF